MKLKIRLIKFKKSKILFLISIKKYMKYKNNNKMMKYKTNLKKKKNKR